MKIKPRAASYFSVMIFTLAFCLSSLGAHAGGPSMKEGSAEKIPIYKSRNLKIKDDIQRISIGNAEIADILILKSNELYVLGKALGTTNVMVWDENDKVIDIINIEVTHDLNTLRERFYHYLPDQKIGIESSQGQLVLSGQASSLEKMNSAVELARGFSDASSVGNRKSEVLNMMSVGGGHQVMLEVTVAEVQSEVARILDTRMILAGRGGEGGGGIVSGGDMLDALGDGATQGLFATYFNSDMLFSFALNVAKKNSLVKILAEPNITALSGQQAEFLSGGEFPIPVTNGDGNTTIEYRDFGVGVSFVPTVLDSGKINLNLKVLVSELVSTNLVTVDSGTNPFSLNKRTTSTTVELGDGQTIVIGGLISDSLKESVDKIPGFGDIPVLGQLFRSQAYIKGQTELVIMVTPRLVRPFNKEGIALPTDNFVAASDRDFYLLGTMTKRNLSDKGNTSPNPGENVGTDMLPNSGGTQEKYGQEL